MEALQNLHLHSINNTEGKTFQDIKNVNKVFDEGQTDILH
jgi:hypothetical protein